MLPSTEALHRVGLKPIQLSTKEGLALVSGTTSVTAFAAMALCDAVTLVRTQDIAAAMSDEVLKANLMSADPRLMAVRPHPDQGKTAENIRKILKDSPILAAYPKHRLQDPLSMRCIPQLHGPVKKAIKDGVEVLNIELNSSVDNPLLFEEEDGTPVALMGCNSDGTYAGLYGDFLNLNAEYSNGLMMIQYVAGGLLNELRVLVHPSIVDNFNCSANQEDYTNMGYTAAKKSIRQCTAGKIYLCH